MLNPFKVPNPIRIGTRKSVLALAQTEIFRQSILRAFPMFSIELVPMLTTGDHNADRRLADIGGKGLFTKELEEALLEGHIDLAVHSLKDMETTLPEGLTIGAVLPRDDPRDALVAKDGFTLADLPAGARVGTSSPRRTAQLKIARHDLEIVPLRGNVPTRIAKIKNSEADATLLALAGLKRLGLESEATETLSTEHFIPAAGQGIIAVECLEDNEALRNVLGPINHSLTHSIMLAERSLLATIDGSCRTPIGAYAHIENDRLILRAMVAKPDGSAQVQTVREGAPQDAVMLGKDAGAELLARGAKDWLP